MFRMLVAAAAVGIFAAQECRAQFVDNFDGDVLAPHWDIYSDPSHLEHSVAGGLLTVTGLPYPSGKHSPTNDAGIRSLFTPVSGDFLARATVGWAAGELRTFRWSLGSLPSAQSIGSVQYSEAGAQGPRLSITAGALSNVVPAPASGMQEWVFQRQGAELQAFVNGDLLLSATVDPQQAVGIVGMSFSIRFPNSGMQPIYVDRIEVIPSPGSAAAVALGIALNFCRRRR